MNELLLPEFPPPPKLNPPPPLLPPAFAVPAKPTTTNAINPTRATVARGLFFRLFWLRRRSAAAKVVKQRVNIAVSPDLVGFLEEFRGEMPRCSTEISENAGRLLQPVS